jgi:copper transport protein
VRSVVASALVAAAALALPSAAWSHAALLKTVPAASVVVSSPPKTIALVFSEAVEPRFAIVSVTDAAAHQFAGGPARRSSSNVDELDVSLKPLREGWFLVVWRVISADGHPVRGAYTFAVGPNQGPAPQFTIPTLSETAATPSLVTARWVVFLSLLAALGLLTLRIAIARPLVARMPGTQLRAVSVAFWVALAVSLVATPVYLLMATAQFALRSFWSIGALIPLVRVSAFGRGFVDLELVLLLFGVSAGIALWLDRPERAQRSIAALLALGGAALAAGAALLVPGVAGHAGQTSPRALALTLDWLHLCAAALWIGGLVGLLVLWRSLPVAQRVAGLVVAVPRFSTVAFASVAALLGSGIAASVLHLPTLASLWDTSYGKAIIVKALLLAGAMLVGAVNLLRTTPRLRASVDAPLVGAGAAALLRRLVAGEVVLLSGAVLAAAVLSSLPPPPKALGDVGQVNAHTGPGPVARDVQHGAYRVEVRVSPNRAAVPNDFSVRLTRNGAPVRGADVVATVTMLDMEMPAQSYRLAETAPGLYAHAAPALVMVGRWGLSFDVRPRGAQPFTILFLDRANG